jgi:hypothetical protein
LRARPIDATDGEADTVEVRGIDLDALDVPVLTGLQAQGDLLVVPGTTDDALRDADFRPVPPKGIPVLRGEHDHTLVADPGACRCSVAGAQAGNRLGLVEVSTTAYLVHIEHATLGLGPGIYTLHRQREATPEPSEINRYVVD